jgi:hypothetical protein
VNENNEALIAILSLAFTAPAQQLPDGPGRPELEKCKQCHELARSISLRQIATADHHDVQNGGVRHEGNDKTGLVTDYLPSTIPPRTS